MMKKKLKESNTTRERSSNWYSNDGARCILTFYSGRKMPSVAMREERVRARTRLFHECASSPSSLALLRPSPSLRRPRRVAKTASSRAHTRAKLPIPQTEAAGGALPTHSDTFQHITCFSALAFRKERARGNWRETRIVLNSHALVHRV